MPEFLKQVGYPRVVNLAGGILAWSDEIDPKVPSTEAPTIHLQCVMEKENRDQITSCIPTSPDRFESITT